MDKERLTYNFPSVRFGLMPGVPKVDGAPDTANGDGIRIGSARILTLGANGTATAGTLYVHDSGSSPSGCLASPGARA